MESYGFPMCIHVSNDAKNLLSEKEEWIGIENRTIEGSRFDTPRLNDL